MTIMHSRTLTRVACTDTGSAVLIVEDNKMNREMLTRRLERKGFTVVEAGDTTTALSIARRRPIGVAKPIAFDRPVQTIHQLLSARSR